VSSSSSSTAGEEENHSKNSSDSDSADDEDEELDPDELLDDDDIELDEDDLDADDEVAEDDEDSVVEQDQKQQKQRAQQSAAEDQQHRQSSFGGQGPRGEEEKTRDQKQSSRQRDGAMKARRGAGRFRGDSYEQDGPDDAQLDESIFGEIPALKADLSDTQKLSVTKRLVGMIHEREEAVKRAREEREAASKAEFAARRHTFETRNPEGRRRPAGEYPPPPEGLTVKAFLNFIGKECEDHVEAFESFEQLMTMKSRQMKDLEIPVKQRRWILRWVEKYKQGLFPDLQELRRRGRQIPI